MGLEWAIQLDLLVSKTYPELAIIHHEESENDFVWDIFCLNGECTKLHTDMCESETDDSQHICAEKY